MAEPGAIEDLKTRLAIYKAAQEMIEASFDIIAMQLRDKGFPPKDDYSNLTQARDAGLLTTEFKDILREANGLRNRLVHEYNGLVDQLAWQALEHLLPYIKRFFLEMREWTENFFSTSKSDSNH